jgi:hypothetical protein
VKFQELATFSPSPGLGEQIRKIINLPDRKASVLRYINQHFFKDIYLRSGEMSPEVEITFNVIWKMLSFEFIQNLLFISILYWRIIIVINGNSQNRFRAYFLPVVGKK